jgi:hypothetical protein
MKYACITTFSASGYEQYGRRFLETYLKHWNVPIWVYWEGPDHPNVNHDLLTWMDLNLDEDRRAFMGRHTDHPSDYRFQIIRFAHKIWALTDPERIEEVDTENWIWLDADIETTDTVDDAFLETICPAGFCGAYLGRLDWNHSECGFVSYNRRYGGIAFLSELRKIYRSDEILNFDEHHDSFIFDQIRKGWWYNISEGVRGNHVFDDSILGKKMRHHKGPQRKKGEKPPKRLLSKKELKKIKDDHPISMTGEGGKMPLVVKTRNCVADKKIMANIRYFATLVDQYMVECAAHDGVVVFCSGGPSINDYIDEIKKLKRKKNHFVVCVKHAHDLLIENGIIPWACILLDPRGHVQDFVENPHKKVRYLAASMVHPSTVDTLLERDVKVWGYHAHVGAGEEDVVREMCGEKAALFGGGCSTAMRGISALHAAGFRKFKLYGYDLCYFGEVDWKRKDKHGNPFYMKVEVCGKEFVTDAEKVAQAQDFTKLMKEKTLNMEVYGPGMIPHIWNAKRSVLPDFRDVYA